MAVKVEHVSHMPVKVVQVLSMAVKGEHVSRMAVKVEHVSRMAVKVVQVLSMAVKGEHVFGMDEIFGTYVNT